MAEHWSRPRFGETQLVDVRVDATGTRTIVPLGTVIRVTATQYTWTAGAQSGESQSEYAAMRAVRRALRAQEVNLDPRD